MQEKNSAIELLKRYEGAIQKEEEYQTNIFSMVPKLRDLMQDYDRSLMEMKLEEQKFKNQFKLEYSAISKNVCGKTQEMFTHDSKDIEDIIRLNSSLKSQLEELP